MTRKQQLAGHVNGFHYQATVPADRPASDYTPGAFPARAGVAVPLEIDHICWKS